MSNNGIAIVDCGGQTAHLIQRRLRDLGVQSKIFPPSVIPGVLKSFSGIILSGGPQSVYEPGAPFVQPQILELGMPVLAICYGQQLVAQMLGGEVKKGHAEYGAVGVGVLPSCPLFWHTPVSQTVWISHTDSVMKLPPECLTIAWTKDCPIAGFAHHSRPLFALQFHPESSHTQEGTKILGNFAFVVCKIIPEEEATIEDVIDETLDEIREIVEDKSVFFLLSGGVDSTVAFVLCAKALGKERVLGIHVDTGLMPKGETERLLEGMKELGLADRVQVQHEAQRFFYRLMRVEDPEEKRRAIGRLFVMIQAEAMQDFDIDPAKFLLGQGTIYPDTIESGGSSGLAAVIKTHHNRCPEIQELIQQGRVIEPLRGMYKDEVRRVGAALGIPRGLLSKWPFPGPGLAVRVLGQVTAERVALVQQADEIIETEIRAAGLYDSIWQAFAILLPVQSVGVKGDQRSFGEVIGLRIVDSQDGMTATWAQVPHDPISRIATRIVNEVNGISRVVLDVTNKPPATIEWE